MNLLRLFQAEIFAEELVGFYFKVLANIFADSLILVDNEILEGAAVLIELFDFVSIQQKASRINFAKGTPAVVGRRTVFFDDSR